MIIFPVSHPNARKSHLKSGKKTVPVRNCSLIILQFRHPDTKKEPDHSVRLFTEL